MKSINNNRGSAVLILLGVLMLGYLSLFSCGRRGWGYAGYGGYYRPSYWYFGGPSVYSGPSARGGSRGGQNHLGGGPRAGK